MASTRLVIFAIAAPGAAAWTSFCAEPGWAAVWADEFEGDTLDLDSWSLDVGPPGDSRTRDAAAVASAVSVGGGALAIRADAAWDDASGAWTNFTSGAIQSQGKRSWAGHTRVCVSAKLPGGGSGAGAGIWPAHWMMPDDSSCWPCHGEIDIMEMVDGDGLLHGTYHWCANSTCGDTPEHGSSGDYSSLKSVDWANEWHEYAAEFDGSGHVAFAFDGTVHLNVTAATPSNADAAPTPLFFDTSYYAILNTAVGGPWPAPPSASTVFPTDHFVDYVRVAQPAAAAAATGGSSVGAVAAAAAAAAEVASATAAATTVV